VKLNSDAQPGPARFRGLEGQVQRCYDTSLDRPTEETHCWCLREKGLEASFQELRVPLYELSHLFLEESVHQTLQRRHVWDDWFARFPSNTPLPA
jgi:hypothetical protein